MLETTGQYQGVASCYVNTAPDRVRSWFQFPTAIRATPGLSIDQPTKLSIDTAGVNALTASYGINIATLHGASIDWIASSGLNAGDGGVIYVAGGASAPNPRVFWDAEL